MNKFMYVATVALMASGMVWAQSSATPSTQDTKGGSSVTTAPQTGGQSDKADPNLKQPGAMSAPETANQVTSAKDATPAKGMEKHKKSKTDNTAYDDYDAAGRADAGRR
jgi:hypothetical protein